MILLELRGLAFRYPGARTNALTEIGASIGRGELISVVGPNGSGKSTLLKLLARVFPPSSGEMLFNGRRIDEWDPRQYARAVGYLPQQAEPDLSMSALDVVLSGRAPYLGRFGWETAEDVRIACEALAECDATELATRDLDEMSGGEQKRVFLARVLAGQPEVIVLDEPLAALDPAHVTQFIRLLRGIVDRTNRTVIFVSHDLNWSAAASDRILLLHEGRLVADTTPAGFMQPDLLRRYFDLDPEIVPAAGGKRMWIVPREL